MGKACWTIPCVRNKQGEIVESKLWHDIYDLTGGDRVKSKELYKIATNKDFIEAVNDKAEFDKNGQITARSFFSLSGRGDEIDDIIKKLNEKYSLETDDIDDVLDSIEEFNEEESFKEDYVPLVSNDDNGISLTITDRTIETVEALEEKLQDMKLTNLIKSRLKELGVAYDFIGSQQYAGRFSIGNAEKTQDGLYHLIQLSQNGDVNDALVEEAAHLATVSMKDNTLIQRLLSMINSDTINELFTKEEIEQAQINTEEGKLELAGILVKKAMLKKKINGFSNFMSRVLSAIYNIFSKGNLNKLLSDKTRARMYARQIANGFLYNENAIDIELATENNSENPVELFSLSLSGTNKLLQESLKKMSVLHANIKNASELLWKNILSDLSTGKLLKGRGIESLSYEETTTIAANGILDLTEKFTTLMRELGEVNFNDDVSQEVINKLHTATQIFRTAQEILTLFKDYVNNNKGHESSEIITALEETINKVRDELNKEFYPSKLLDYERAISAQIFGHVLGKNEYRESARIVFKDGKLQRKEEWAVTTSSLALKYINERKRTYIDGVTDYIRHNNNAPDITTQIFYQAIRKLKINQARKYKESLSELKTIEDLAKKLKVDVTKLYERDNEGNLTGNFIGKYNLGEYEAEKSRVIKKIKEDFLKYLKDNNLFEDYMNQTKEEKNQQFLDFRNLRSDWQEIYELNRSDLDDIREILNGEENQLAQENPELFNEILQKFGKYFNYDYDRLSDNEITILNKIKEWKDDLDKECLLEGVEDINDLSGGHRIYVKDRIPQFRSGLINKMKDIIDDMDLFNPRHLKEVNLNILSSEFGSPIMDKEQTEFNDRISLADDAVRRIPLYGIEKLEDMSQLSTNLFASLAFYAGMAHRYHTTQLLYPELMIMDDALRRREAGPVKNNTDWGAVADKTREKLMDDFIAPKKKKQNLFKKGLNVISMLASIRVLCLSYMSAAKNWVGGYRVIFNDAVAGNGDFSFRALMRATGRSFNPKHIIQKFATIFLNKEVSWDKYQNIVRRWDAARNPHVHTSAGQNAITKGWNYICNIIMSNYSITDESLIAITYDAHMNSPTFYDARNKGKKVKLSKNGYVFDENNNPSLKDSLVKKQTDVVYCQYLNDAIEEISRIQEENEYDTIKVSLQDPNRIIDNLIDFIRNNRHNTDFSAFHEDGTYKTLEEFKNELLNLKKEIVFTEDDEINLCEQINDYITSSQGLYGALNANAIQNDAGMAMFGKLKGWLFGFIQRNMLSNSSILLGDYKNSVLETELLAIASTFGAAFGTNSEIAGKELGGYLKYTGAVLLSMVFPFLIRRSYSERHNETKSDKALREYLQKMGWSPDQLDKLCFASIGWLIQLCIGAICSKLLTRGNYKKYGEYTYKHKDKRTGRKVKLKEAGLLVKAANLIRENKEVSDEILRKWSDSSKGKIPYPYTLNQKKKIDGEFPDKSNLPTLTSEYIKSHKITESSIFRIKSSGEYYSPKYNENKDTWDWEKVTYGYYQIGTDAWNEHVDAIRYKEYGYEKGSLMYGLLGACYRLGRGVESEGMSLMDPMTMIHDISDITSPIMYTAGIGMLIDYAKKAIDGQWDLVAEKEANFWLKKFGLELDGDGYPIISGENHDITTIDWYDVQDKIDRYNALKNK